MKHLFLTFINILIFSPPVIVEGDAVLGCGGFVKSDVELNFSLVEVKLYSLHGSIKYQTDCAPNTGYYLIPLYDKGDFILKVEPPVGWSFEPASVELHVDGEKDKCSLAEDINFIFTGFSLSGKVVSRNQIVGPAGVTVHLYKADSQNIKQTVQTSQDGSYLFKKVMPGHYNIKAQQGQFKFEKSETNVTLISDNVDAGSSIVIAGYPVTGQVFSEAEPIRGVLFLLYSTTVSQQDVHDCDKSSVPGLSKKESSEPLCHVTSDISGKFTFPCLATGDYYLVPLYKGEHITFDVDPDKLPFHVGHGVVVLEKSFQVEGFSVSGQVLDSVKGTGLAQVQIFVNGEAVTKTDADGIYHLENMNMGQYKLHAKTEDIFFDEQVMRITPNTPQLPDIFPSSLNLCGRVIIDRYPEGLPQQMIKRKLIIFPDGKGSEAVSKDTSEDGKFCIQKKPGRYIVRVFQSDVETKAGLTISPSEQVVTISNRPILDITFTQFRARVAGTVSCIEKCGPLEVSLEAVGRADKQITQAQGAQKSLATFTFENVLPGKYKATVMRDTLCWKEKTIEFDVGNQNVDSLQFVQTGYILKCTISHPITLNFAQEQKEGSVGSFELNKGKNRFCLAQSGVYQLTPSSCHKFEKDIYYYDTSNPETLTLTAISHLVLGVLKTETLVNDAFVWIISSLDQAVTSIGPLPLDAKSSANDTKPAADGIHEYRFSHWTRTGEKLTVSVKSSEMLYTPVSTEITVIGDTCPGEMIKFKGELGLFIIGHVYPPLAGVQIIVHDSEGKMEPVITESSQKGDFKIGPLPKSYNYEVKAEKEGYVLVKDDGEMTVFHAKKLSKIVVKITDEQQTALSEVLLSLSGDKQYRNNNLTKEDGTMSFPNLSPGQYFLRPMMKEYKFEPSSQMVDVKEGTIIDINIKGFRTAYSCYGQVTSLNGEPEPGVFVEAVGQNNCSSYLEESKTDLSGHYRIRGLQPQCTYETRLKIGDMNKHIEKAAPPSRLVVVENSDLQGINIIAFRKMNQMDISGNVVTNPEYLPTLKLRLYKDDNPGVPIYTAPLGAVSFFYLPSLQMDDSVYYVRLESSLSKNNYEFVQLEVEIKANVSYKHVTFKFEPKRKSLEQELSQSSVLMLPLTLLIIFLGYNYKKLVPVGLQIVSQIQSNLPKQQQQSNLPKQQQMAAAAVAQQQGDIQQQYSALQDLQDSPVSKKKNKPRKT